MEKKFKISKELAIGMIAVERRYFGDKLYEQILNDPKDHNHDWLNKLEDIANGRMD